MANIHPNLLRPAPVALTLILMGVAPIGPVGAAHAEPIALLPAELDQVTAGALALANADAVATGSPTYTDTITDAYADPTRAKAKAKGVALGTDGAGASSEIYLEGDYISALIGGAAVALTGGKAKSRTRGRVRTGKNKEVLVIKTRLVGRGPLNDVDIFRLIDAPDGARIRTSITETQQGGKTVLFQVVRITYRFG